MSQWPWWDLNTRWSCTGKNQGPRLSPHLFCWPPWEPFDSGRSTSTKWRQEMASLRHSPILALNWSSWRGQTKSNPANTRKCLHLRTVAVATVVPSWYIRLLVLCDVVSMGDHEQRPRSSRQHLGRSHLGSFLSCFRFVWDQGALKGLKLESHGKK